MEHPVKLKYGSFTGCYKEKNGGDERARTADPHVANVVLSQLSYIPTMLIFHKTLMFPLQPHSQKINVCNSHIIHTNPL